MKLEIETKFKPGDIVTFRAMQALEETQGNSQAFSVVSLRIWIGEDHKETNYFCRPFISSPSRDSCIGEQSKQGIHFREATITGLLLFDEVELVAYKQPELKSDD